MFLKLCSVKMWCTKKLSYSVTDFALMGKTIKYIYLDQEHNISVNRVWARYN